MPLDLLKSGGDLLGESEIPHFEPYKSLSPKLMNPSPTPYSLNPETLNPLCYAPAQWAEATLPCRTARFCFGTCARSGFKS